MRRAYLIPKSSGRSGEYQHAFQCPTCKQKFWANSFVARTRKHCSRPCYFHETEEDRFWKCVIRNSKSTCWGWTGALGRHGYGKMYAGKKTVSAHRFSWLLHRGKIPNG